MPNMKNRDYPMNDSQLAAKVEEGVPVLDLVAFGREANSFTIGELAKLIQIPPRTYARRVASKARLKAR